MVSEPRTVPAVKNAAAHPSDTRLAAIPLDLTPLVAAFTDGEDYTLRVEKLPDRGHLSTGRNNGDCTWSLKSSDLAGLTYLPPEGAAMPHTLEVRVVRLKDDTATTVAFHEVAVAPPAAADGLDPSDEDEAGYDDEDETDYDVTEDDTNYATALSNQLNAGRSIGAKEIDGLLVNKGTGAMAQPTESELVLRLEQSLQEAQDETALALAAATERYENAETALAESAGQLGVLQKEHIELQATRDELQARLEGQEFELAKVREDVKRATEEGSEAQVAAALAKAQARWDKQLEDSLATSAADSERRFEGVRKELEDKATAELAAASERYGKAETALAQLAGRTEALQKDHASLQSARDELQSRLEDREAELAKARQDVVRATEEGSKTLIAAALTKAEAEWDAQLEDRLTKSAADADRRLESARKELQDKAAADLAAAAVRYEEAEEAVEALRDRVEALQETEGALRKTQVKFSVLQNRKEALEEELTLMRDALQEAQKNGPGETVEAALSTAREAWEAELKNRLSKAIAGADRRHEDARKEWEASAARDLDNARARYEKAETTVEELQDRVEALRSAEIALQGARSEIVELQAKFLRLEQERSDWERQPIGELEAAKARYETAEASAQALRRRVEELNEAQAALSQELEAMRSSEHSVSRAPEGPESPARLARAAAVAHATWAAAKWINRYLLVPIGHFLWRLCPRRTTTLLAIAALAGIVIGAVYYPTYAPVVSKASQPIIDKVERASLSFLISTAFRIGHLMREEPETSVEYVYVNVDTANVREGPSTATKTITTLPRDSKLVVIERRGNWVLVEVEGEGVQTGWIYNTLLTDA